MNAYDSYNWLRKDLSKLPWEEQTPYTPKLMVQSKENENPLAFRLWLAWALLAVGWTVILATVFWS